MKNIFHCLHQMTWTGLHIWWSWQHVTPVIYGQVIANWTKGTVEDSIPVLLNKAVKRVKWELTFADVLRNNVAWTSLTCYPVHDMTFNSNHGKDCTKSHSVMVYLQSNTWCRFFECVLGVGLYKCAYHMPSVQMWPTMNRRILSSEVTLTVRSSGCSACCPLLINRNHHMQLFCDFIILTRYCC